jgi:hypothetical protein
MQNLLLKKRCLMTTLQAPCWFSVKTADVAMPAGQFCA